MQLLHIINVTLNMELFSCSCLQLICRRGRRWRHTSDVGVLWRCECTRHSLHFWKRVHSKNKYRNVASVARKGAKNWRVRPAPARSANQRGARSPLDDVCRRNARKKRATWKTMALTCTGSTRARSLYVARCNMSPTRTPAPSARTRAWRGAGDAGALRALAG